MLDRDAPVVAASVGLRGQDLRARVRGIDVPRGATPAHAAACTGYVGLTFDDGPSNDKTPAILNALRQNGLRATMFNEGQFAAAYPAQVRAQISAVGGQPQLHTHPHLLGGRPTGTGDLGESTSVEVFQIHPALCRCQQLPESWRKLWRGLASPAKCPFMRVPSDWPAWNSESFGREPQWAAELARRAHHEGQGVHLGQSVAA